MKDKVYHPLNFFKETKKKKIKVDITNQTKAKKIAIDQRESFPEEGRKEGKEKLNTFGESQIISVSKSSMQFEVKLINKLYLG